LFETTYFKVGNMLIGNSVEVWNPKSGFSVTTDSRINVLEFDSGFDSDYKKGRSFRLFEGEFDKITTAENAKIPYSLNPFALYIDWTGNAQSCYLVKNRREFKKVYEMADTVTRTLVLKEVV